MIGRTARRLGWPPDWLAAWAARRLLRTHGVSRAQYGGTYRCPCSNCDRARAALEMLSLPAAERAAYAKRVLERLP